MYKMELTYSLWFMMTTSFIIQLIFMSGIMTDSYKNITFRKCPNNIESLSKLHEMELYK